MIDVVCGQCELDSLEGGTFEEDCGSNRRSEDDMVNLEVAFGVHMFSDSVCKQVMAL